MAGFLMVVAATASGGVAYATGSAGPPPFECSYDFENTYMDRGGERWICINENGGNTFPSGYQWVRQYQQV